MHSFEIFAIILRTESCTYNLHVYMYIRGPVEMGERSVLIIYGFVPNR